MMKMKLNKKIAGAAAMLLLSATMLGTSTFAWFTMNTKVEVDGLQLTAKADSTYLIIGETSDINTLQTNNYKKVTLSNASLRVFPSAHNAVTNTTGASNVSNWFFKYANVPTNYASSGSAQSLRSGAFETDYVLHKTVYVTLAKGSQQAANLKCTAINFTAADDAQATGNSKTHNPVTVLVTSPSNTAELEKGGLINSHVGSSVAAADCLSATVTDSSVVQLDIWVYYYGEDPAVYTNNIANLDGAAIDLVFEVDYTPAMNP